MWIDLVTSKSEDERLIFTFRLYDADGSGKIDLQEMAKVIETLDGLGKTVISCLNREYKFKRLFLNFPFQQAIGPNLGYLGLCTMVSMNIKQPNHKRFRMVVLIYCNTLKCQTWNCKLY